MTYCFLLVLVVEKKELEKDLREACRLDPEHLSTYCLTFEEDTALWVKLSEGKIKQDLELDAELYESTWDQLTAAGYEHYEISNFSKAGRECLHNINTWKMKEWIGVGPSAASQFQNIRYSNAADMDTWLEQVDSKVESRCDVVKLSDEDLLEDAVIFGLRMGQGISIESLSRRFSSESLGSLTSFFDSLNEEGLVTISHGDKVCLTMKGKLLADRIAIELLKAAF